MVDPVTKEYRMDALGFLREASDLDLTDAVQESGECGGEFLISGPKMPRVTVWLGVKDHDDEPPYNLFEVVEVGHAL